MFKIERIAFAACLAVGAVSLAADSPDPSRSAEQALERGWKYLAQQQGSDGGWHSQTYGQLKGGPGITSLVLYSFSRYPAQMRAAHPELAKRGFAFFQPGLKLRGAPAATDGSLDYPTYAAAFWLTARQRLKLPAPPGEQDKMVRYLLSAQLLESRGFAPDHPAHGGWDFLGAGEAQGITTGSNVSLAASILEALAETNQTDAAAQKAREHALAWLQRAQQPDGGFSFTPEPASLNNKALFHDEKQLRPRSYGTATSDGLRALIAAGLKTNDARVQKSVNWLVEHRSLDVVPGFEELPPELGWQRGLRFYYYASLAEASRHFPPSERDARRRALLELLVREQRAGGSWVNESARMREDDPLIATSFALAALGSILDEGPRK